MRQRWTSEEINLIRTGFLAGKLVKTIASEVGRTPTAVNKFLSRSGIRTRRWTIDRTRTRISSIDVAVNMQHPKEQIRTSEVVTKFQEVVGFLKANGYTVSRNEQSSFAPMCHYKLNNMPTSNVKMLLIANRLRCENHQPVFAVPELSWV